jgi:Replication-relaxation
MKCNLAAPSLLSVVPASSLAPLALGAFAIASALAPQRLNTEPRRGGRQGRRSRGRTDARTDRRAGKERRHPAPSAAVGLPEATAEIIASLGEHRVLSTEQVRMIHLADRSLRRTQQVLAGIEEAGLIQHVDTRIAPRRLWFVSERGAALAFELVGLETQPRVLQAADAAGPLRAHTLAVNDAAICFLKAARERDDEFGPFSWRQEVAHPMSRGRGRRRRTLFADAVLAYQRHEEDGTALELDRATLSVDRLVAELSRYAQLYRATDAEGESP